MRYGDNKPKYIRYAIYAAVICGAFMLQSSKIALPEIFGARAFLLLPVCICVSMHEREIPAALFGALAGALWDVSAGVEGFNTLVIMLLCAACSIFISHLMQNNIVTAFVLNASACAIYELLYVIVNIVVADGGNPFRQIFVFYLPSLIYTVAFVPLCYSLMKHIYSLYKTE